MLRTLSNGIRLYYEIKNPENVGSTIVLIHHLAGSVNSWKYVSPALKSRTVVYDLRGHGRSSSPVSTYYIEDHANDLRELLEEENIKDPILVGHSLGSLIALEYSTKNNIDKLVLIGALYKAPKPDLYEKYVRIALNFGMRGLAEYRRSINQFPRTIERDERIWRDILGVYMENNPIGYKYSVEGLLKARDYSRDLDRIDVPTLIIYGSEDEYVQNATIFSKGLKKSKLSIIEGFGHFINFEAPELLNNELHNFLYSTT